MLAVIHSGGARPSPRRLIALAILAPLFLIAADAVAQSKRPVRATDLFRIRLAQDIALAPDGERVAFVVAGVDSVTGTTYSHLWVAGRDGDGARQLTFGPVRDRKPIWSPDGSRLAFISRREADVPQIWTLPVDGGDAQRLTHLVGGAADPVWLPDGRGLVFTSSLTLRETGTSSGDATGMGESPRAAPAATNGSESEVANAPDAAMWGETGSIRRWLDSNARDRDPMVLTRLGPPADAGSAPRSRHVYRVDLATGSVRRLTHGPLDFRAPTVSPDGRRIAVTVRSVDARQGGLARGADLYVLELGSGARRRIPVPGASALEARWSPDGQRLAFTARDTTDPDAAVEIGTLDAASAGPPRPSWLTRPLDRDVRGFRWSPDGASIYFSAAVHGTVPIYRVGLEGRDIRQIISGERGIVDLDIGDDALAYSATEPANPSEVYAAHLDGDDERRLTDLNAGWLERVQVRPHNGFWYRSYDDRRIQGWLLEPGEGGSNGPHPLAVHVHSRVDVMWGPADPAMWLEFQLLAAKGYAVLYTNPRGSDGYGREFRRAGRQDGGEGVVLDVQAALDSVLTRAPIDPERVVLAGRSVGTDLSAILLARDPRFRAAVSRHDAASPAPARRSTASTSGGAAPDDAGGASTPEPPLGFAGAIQAPVLIVAADPGGQPGVSTPDLIFGTLKLMGKQVEYARYPIDAGERPSRLQPRQRIDQLLRILEFFDRHLPEPEEVAATP